MENITKYSDVGTPERHKKFGGVYKDNVEGQIRARVHAEDCFDVLLIGKVINQEQYNACFQLSRDYKIGCLYKWKKAAEHLRGSGLSQEEAEEERQRAKLAFYAAIKYNPQFTRISDMTHIIIDQIGFSIPAPWKIQQLADRLIKYYKGVGRNK